jgi:3-hydroxyacyl-[acyl-carrier-protein] dehydratase
MAPPLLFDVSNIDLNRVQVDVAGIEAINPHRGAMRMLDGINYISEDKDRAVAFKDVRPDEFWVEGHIPGRPIFPGVLMIEAGAQLASYITIIRLGTLKFMGFAGVDKVKFRGQVVPGDRLVIIGHELECKPRRSICAVQGLVRGTLMFEATVTGMPI